ncbi:MAG: potassium transporter TrkG [Pseudomonadota bacterium]
MGFTTILRGFAACLMCIAFAMIAPLMVATAGGEESAGRFLFAFVATLAAGVGAWAASIGRRPSADFRGALVIVLLWWTVAPVFAAIPMALGPADFADAYFEAIAALTTTGGWLSPETAIASPSGMLWRALLQWIGGLASLAIAAAIFIRPAFIGIDTLLPPFSRGDKANFVRPLRNAISSFFSVYAILTALIFALLAAAGAPTYDAVIMALSTAASGGFLPNADGASGYSIIVLSVLCAAAIVSGANFVVIARLFRLSGDRLRDVETGAYLMILIFVAVLFWVLAGAGDVDLVIPQFFNAASVLSTNGFIIGETPPLPAVMVTAIIGGAAVSTAGGLKILRWLVIMQRGREEIRRLIAPSAVFGKRRVSNELGVWIHFLVFTMTLGVLMVALSVGGHSFELTATAAIGALSNTGPLIYLSDAGSQGFAAIGEGYRWFLAAAMILGRLEAAVALALINRWFWRT